MPLPDFTKRTLGRPFTNMRGRSTQGQLACPVIKRPIFGREHGTTFDHPCSIFDTLTVFAVQFSTPPRYPLFNIRHSSLVSGDGARCVRHRETTRGLRGRLCSDSRWQPRRGILGPRSGDCSMADAWPASLPGQQSPQRRAENARTGMTKAQSPAVVDPFLVEPPSPCLGSCFRGCCLERPHPAARPERGGWRSCL